MIDPINITITHALGWINKDKYTNCSGSHRRQAPNATEGKKDLLNRHRTTQQKHLPVSMSSASRPGLKSMVSLNLFLLSKYCLINVSLMDYPMSSSEVVVKKTGLEQKGLFVLIFLYLLSLYCMHYRLWLRSVYWIWLGRWLCLPT